MSGTTGNTTYVPDYPAMIASPDQIEPVPRRIRATLAGQTVLDTTRALYVWEWPTIRSTTSRSPM